jgi:hypothetical protein
MKILETGLVGPMPTTGGAYMPAVTPLPYGELIGTRFVASSLVAPDGRIEVFQSQDGGHTWTEPTLIWPDDG